MPQVGFESALYINTGVGDGTGEAGTEVWTEIDLARDVTDNREKDEIDSTSRATARTGYKSVENGLKSFSIEFESLVPKPTETVNPAFAALKAAWAGNTTVEVLMVDGGTKATDDLNATFAVCNVFGGSRGEPLNDVTTIKYSVKAVEAPIEGTTESGAFVPAGS